METYQNDHKKPENSHNGAGCCSSNTDCCSGGEFIKSDREILHIITKTTSMAIESIKDLLNSCEDCSCTPTLKRQLECYENIYRIARSGLGRIGEDAEKIGSMQKMMLWTATKWDMMMDDSQTKIAEMLIRGTAMGVVEVARGLSDFKEVSSKSGVCLAEKLLDDMSMFVDELKKLL